MIKEQIIVKPGAVNQLTILLTGLFLLLVTTDIVVGQESNQLELKDACEMALQGKVAWDDKGTVEWGDAQIKKLCGSSMHSIQPAICFSEVMQSDMTQGNGHAWEWYNAIKLCKQTLNSEQTINCYQKNIKSKGQKRWKSIITDCNSITTIEPKVRPLVIAPPAVAADSPDVKKVTPVIQNVAPVKAKVKPVVSNKRTLSVCKQAFQGKVAWNYKGSKKWNMKNLNRICKGVEESLQPSMCFNQVMHGGINWGGGTQWVWPNVLRLCESVKNASVTVTCFVDNRASGQDWKPAISACNKVGVSSNVSN